MASQDTLSTLKRFDIYAFQQKRFEDLIDFVDQCDTNFKKMKRTYDYCEWSNTITIKLDAGCSEEYTNKFGINFMNEETFILGDDINNIHMVYQDENKIIPEKVASCIHILNKLCITPKMCVHKLIEPAKIPPHIRVNLNFIQNNIANQNVYNGDIINNGDTINNVDIINQNLTDLHILSPPLDTLESYLETYFTKGGTIPIKRLSRHPEWKKEYRNLVTTRKADMCKSCHKKFLKGCCANYSRHNRTSCVLVIGWHEKPQ